MNIKIIKEPTTFRYISIDIEATDEKLFDLNAEDIKQLEEQLLQECEIPLTQIEPKYYSQMLDGNSVK